MSRKPAITNSRGIQPASPLRLRIPRTQSHVVKISQKCPQSRKTSHCLSQPVKLRFESEFFGVPVSLSIFSGRVLFMQIARTVVAARLHRVSPWKRAVGWRWIAAGSVAMGFVLAGALTFGQVGGVGGGGTTFARRLLFGANTP